MPAAKRAKQSRSHTMGGCATCRRRHVKCDQVRPHCLTCRAIDVTCGGFANALRWVSPAAESVQQTLNAGRTSTADGVRRHLYTEQSMQSMSAILVSNLVANSVDASLSDIDTRSKTVSNTEAHDISVGPFGVLNLGTQVVDVQSSVDLHAVDGVLSDTEAADISPLTVESFENFNDMLDWSDLFALDFSDVISANIAQPFVSSLPTNNQHNNIDALDRPINQVENISDEHALAGETSFGPQISDTIDLGSPVYQLLLKHYNTHVILNMSSLPVGRHSPWRILNVSAAVRTLADMTYLDGKDVKNANLANLFALIAIAASDMARNPLQTTHTPDYWQSLGRSAGNEAKRYLQQSLVAEFQGLGKAKYKDQLMAILAMISYSAIVNNQNEARSYMIDAERLLRIRGLAKRAISRKARLLHHVYTWFRIIGESTYVLHDYTKTKVPLGKISSCQSSCTVDEPLTFSHTRTGQNARLDDFLRLEVSESEDGLDIETPKSREVGLYDIHLEDPREDPETMHPCIYGVSETWLTLVSQTTRLANVIDALNYNEKGKDMRIMESLQKRIERLENLVCAFAARTPSNATSTRDQPTGVPDTYCHYVVRECLNRALNSALIIFFYRRVRKVNSWILQCHVDDVIVALNDFDKAMKDSKRPGHGTVWPAFMAGCEALGSDRRERIKICIERGLTSGNSASFQVALDTVQELWRLHDIKSPAAKRKKSGIPAVSEAAKSGECTWMDLLRENGTWPMFY